MELWLGAILQLTHSEEQNWWLYTKLRYYVVLKLNPREWKINSQIILILKHQLLLYGISKIPFYHSQTCLLINVVIWSIERIKWPILSLSVHSALYSGWPALSWVCLPGSLKMFTHFSFSLVTLFIRISVSEMKIKSPNYLGFSIDNWQARVL